MTRAPDLGVATAVVTGASRGIGLAITRALAERGARVLALGRDTATLESARIAAGIPPDRFEAHRVDLARPRDVTAVAHQLGCLRRVDVLVHCAAEHHAGGMEATSAATFRRLMQVNVFAPYELSRAVLPQLTAGPGQVVFVNSSAARAPAAGTSLYAASKAALAAVADGLRAEVNPCGVRVLSIYPGRTATAMQEQIFADEGRPYQPHRLLQADDIASAVVAALLLPRTAEVTDVHIRPLQKWG